MAIYIVLIVDLAMKHGNFLHSYVTLYQRVIWISYGYHLDIVWITQIGQLSPKCAKLYQAFRFVNYMIIYQNLPIS